ncbi:MAG: amidohydrolase family protein [Planctomycetes bacterium]|nr:amidohydrolase family protein [Planctomycetota bacterium]
MDVWRDRGTGAVLMRLTAGLGGGHALQRQQALEAMVKAFDGLDAYKKAFDDHKKALEKYTTDYEAYLSFYRKKKEGEKAGGATAPPAGATPPAPPTGNPPAGGDRPRGRRGEGGGRGNQGNGGGVFPDPSDEVLATGAQDPKPEPPKTEASKQDPAPAANAPKSEDKPPAKPEFPKAPPRDPAKDALTRVLDGSLALRIEAIRADEIRAALAMARAKKLPLVILEQAYGAATVAAELATAGVSCVLTELLPASLPREADELDPTKLPAQLHARGVPFAIATGSARRASLLPLMAAAAIGQGLDAEAALRAVTLTPAELLGIAKDTGSLQAGKLADLIVTDKPLFASDSRVLRVLSAGATTWEAK